MTNDAIKQVADHAHKLVADATTALKVAQDGLAGVQAVCPHDWLDEGYDPRGGGTQHDKCRLCGLKRRS